VCVGNLTVGGSGKTPVAKAIAGRLRDLGLRAHFLARGHGGRLSGPVLVDPRQHTAREVGDEALVLAADGPVWVARNRAAGARSAASGGAQVIVMDDGHQNASVTKTLSLVAVDGETRRGEWPFGDGAIFPRGPLREPISSGLARANAVVVLLPADLPEVDPALRDLLEGSTLLVARLEPLSPPPVGLQVGFAGIAKPWRMKQALEAAGCHLADFIAFPDHGPSSESDLRGLARRAAFLGADLITSEKDWVRLPPEWRARMTAWPVRAIFEDQQALDKLLSALGASPTPLTRPP
jgi:tetraacyldisaccharide 4'-kinase